MATLDVVIILFFSTTITLFIRNQLKLSAPCAFYAYCCFVIVLNLSLGYISALNLSIYFFYTIGVACTLWLIIKPQRIQLTNKSILVFLIFPLLLGISALVNSFRFTFADELVSWGFISKSIWLQESLLNSDAQLGGGFENSFLHYPPGEQLFHFLVTSHFSWTEPIAVISQIVLVSSALVCAANIVSKKTTLPLMVIPLVAYYLFGFSLLSILADGLLAVFFLVCLTLVIFGGLHETKILLPLSVFCIVLIKPAGLIFAVICILILLFNLSENSKNERRRIIRNSLLATIYAWVSWNIYLKLNNIGSGVPEISLANLQSEEFLERLRLSTRNHLSNLTSSLYGPNSPSGISTEVPNLIKVTQISLLAVVLVLFIFQLTLTYYERKRTISHKIYPIAPVLLLSGFFVYQLFLQFIFLFYNSEYEGVNSAGLVRYTSTYLFAWFCVIAFQVLRMISVLKFGTIIVYIGCIFMLINSNIYAEIYSGQSNVSRAKERHKLETLAQSVSSLNLEKTTKVYIVAQNTWGFESLALRLDLLPLRTNRNCWSIDANRQEFDLWSCNASLSTLAKNYDLVLVASNLADFKRKLGNDILANPRDEDSRIFRVEQNSLSFKLVPLK